MRLMDIPRIFIEGRPIGSDCPPYIIAEMSGNHNGDINRALAILEYAKKAGADAVKLQTYTADTITINHDSQEFQIEDGLWIGRTLYDLYRDAHTPWEWHEALFLKGREIGITVFSTPFDTTAVDFLEELGTPAYKIASFEAVDLGLIQKVASTGKPLIISTGLATLGECSDAVNAARESGASEIALLHCVSGYPAPVEESNLRTLPHLGETFKTVVGLSDHSLGTAVSVAAVALGASIIEKHVTLRRDEGGVDSAFSLEPAELRMLCECCNIAWSALGKIDYTLKSSERGNIRFRRSLYAVKDIEAGQIFSTNNVRSIRPGYGLQPKYLTEVLGRQALVSVKRGTAIKWSMIGE